jgi:hypothetical protein
VSWRSQNQWWLDNAKARWSPSTVEPFCVRVWFSSPVAWSRDGIQLDGYLQRLVVERETGMAADDVFSGFPNAEDAGITIPVGHVQIGPYDVACVSWGWPPSVAVESLRWRRRRTRVDVLAMNKVVVAGGAFKSTNIPLPTLATPWLDFYMVGDRAKVRDLLSDATALGRGYGAGYGTILGIEYLPDAEGRSLAWKGRPMRHLPMMAGCPTLSEDFYVDEKPARAPYWKRTNVSMCAIPVVTIG